MKEKIKEEKYITPEISRKEASEELKKNMDVIVNNIQNIMRTKNMNQSELAYAIKSDRGHVNYILKSKTGITVNVLGRIAKALNVKLYEIVK